MVSTTQFATNVLFTLFLFRNLAAGSYSTTLTIVNKCNYTVWPGLLSVTSTSLLSTTGFALPPGESNILNVSSSWSVRVWGRTLCSHDSNGKFSCLTGNCASTVECDGGKAAPPATLAKLNLNGSSGVDFFRVSLVEGYNLPMMVEPQVGNGAGECRTVGCVVDLNEVCPTKLKVMNGRDCIACRSLCQPFGDSKHCYPKFFTNLCPQASVDATKTFQGICSSSSTNYLISFCPKSLIKPRKEKYHSPKTVDNSGDEKKGSTNNITTLLVVIGIIIVIGISITLLKITIVFCSSCTLNLFDQRPSTSGDDLNSAHH